MGQCIMLVILLSRVSIHTSWILSLHFMRISTAHRKSVSGRIVVLRLESERFLGDWIWAETGQRGEGLQNASRGRWRHVMPPRHATCASGICLTSLRSGRGGGAVGAAPWTLSPPATDGTPLPHAAFCSIVRGGGVRSREETERSRHSALFQQLLH